MNHTYLQVTTISLRGLSRVVRHTRTHVMHTRVSSTRAARLCTRGRQKEIRPVQQKNKSEREGRSTKERIRQVVEGNFLFIDFDRNPS